jgi:hypothetical protein
MMKETLITAGLSIVIGFLLGWFLMKPTVVTQTIFKPGKSDTTTVHDTTRLTRWKAGKIDTVFLPGEVVPVEVASFDSSLDLKRGSRADLKIKYFLPPLNHWNVEAFFDIRERLIFRTDTVSITNTLLSSHLNTFFSRIDLGVGYGGVWYQDQLRFVPMAGVYYRIY